MAFDFSRFEYNVDESLLQTVLGELNQGKKSTHWIWFIFPQLRAPNQSETSRYFALRNLDEASDFLQHEVLGPRLIECTQAVVQHQDRTAVEIFGEVDAKKFHRLYFPACLKLIPCLIRHLIHFLTTEGHKHT